MSLAADSIAGVARNPVSPRARAYRVRFGSEGRRFKLKRGFMGCFIIRLEYRARLKRSNIKGFGMPYTKFLQLLGFDTKFAKTRKIQTIEVYCFATLVWFFAAWR